MTREEKAAVREYRDQAEAEIARLRAEVERLRGLATWGTAEPVGPTYDTIRRLEAEVERLTRERETCDGSCDIALARRQVGPDGIVPGNAKECAELWEREAARLHAEARSALSRAESAEARERVLREALEEMAAQHRCGCGHPACKNCQRDRMCASALSGKGESRG